MFHDTIRYLLITYPFTCYIFRLFFPTITTGRLPSLFLLRASPLKLYGNQARTLFVLTFVLFALLLASLTMCYFQCEVLVFSGFFYIVSGV